MAYLFDTNAISEVLKKRPAPAYLEWLEAIPREDQFTSAVVIGELDEWVPGLRLADDASFFDLPPWKPEVRMPERFARGVRLPRVDSFRVEPGGHEMATLTIELPEGVLSTLYKSASDAERDLRLALAIEWYRREEMSQGRAAELAGLSRADFIDELAARKIDVIQVDLEDLRREIEVS